MVRVFKSGRMMFKHKNKFFHFQKHYLFITFKIFIFWGGVKLAHAPRSQLHPGSLWLVRAPSVPLSGSAGRVKGWPPLGMFQAAVP